MMAKDFSDLYYDVSKVITVHGSDLIDFFKIYLNDPEAMLIPDLDEGDKLVKETIKAYGIEVCKFFFEETYGWSFNDNSVLYH